MSEIVVPPTWRERLEELGGRRQHVWIVLAVVVVAVAVALVSRARNQPQIAPPAEAPAAAAAPTVVAPTPIISPVPAGDVILVHVAGAVNRPGLYEMQSGARVADAIDLARGPKAVADLDALNLAEPLSDGQKIDVPRRGEDVEVAAPTSPGAPVTPGAAPTSASVDLNVADQATLETIPGIGPVTAQAIIAYRTEVGQFESIDQLLEVSGIGPATLESMRPYVTI